MDRPPPEGIRVHEVGPFSLMGCMMMILDYQSGDWVRYGGMLYKPDGSGRLAYTQGDYASGGGRGWTGQSGVTKHYMNIGLIPGRGAVILCS